MQGSAAGVVGKASGCMPPAAQCAQGVLQVRHMCAHSSHARPWLQTLPILAVLAVVTAAFGRSNLSQLAAARQKQE